MQPMDMMVKMETIENIYLLQIMIKILIHIPIVDLQWLFKNLILFLKLILYLPWNANWSDEPVDPGPDLMYEWYCYRDKTGGEGGVGGLWGAF